MKYQVLYRSGPTKHLIVFQTPEVEKVKPKYYHDTFHGKRYRLLPIQYLPYYFTSLTLARHLYKLYLQNVYNIEETKKYTRIKKI